MRHLGTVTLETERLILRKARPEDASAMFANWASDDKVTKFMTWPTYTGMEEADCRIAYLCGEYEKDNYYEWFIELKEIGQPIGSIGAVRVLDNVQLAHIGYCMGSKWWGQGIMPEALAAVIRFFFERVGVNRVESCHDVNNPNSGRVMVKCGMQYEGTLRQSGWNNQGVSDRAFYGILREEYLVREKQEVTWDDLRQSGDLLMSSKRYMIEKMKKIYPYWLITGPNWCGMSETVFLLPDGYYMSVFSMRGDEYDCLGMEYGEKAELRPDDGDLYCLSDYETPAQMLEDMLAEHNR